MKGPIGDPVVHLELRSADPARALAFYTQLFGWSAEAVQAGSSSYLALDLGVGIGGGIVEAAGNGSLWLPYVEVTDIEGIKDRAERLGALVRIGTREGPAGWRCVLEVPHGAEVALWQPKI